MKRIRAPFALALFFIVSMTARGQEPIRFARTPDISPDGKTVAFSYLGDIWLVDSIGGVARPLTMHEAHDFLPVFSPDGRAVAFSSNRHGSYDVFVVPVEGGKPRRLTFDSASDLVTGWSPDGKEILFVSNRGIGFPPSLDLYSIPAEGGRARHIGVDSGKDAVFSPQGDRIAYVRGPGTWYRKGYRGSSNDDIWICDANGKNNRRLTTFDGQDGSPMWSADGQSLYYVSEACGSPANIVRQDALGKSPPRALTSQKEDAVRRARISANGRWIVYECGADLWVVSTQDAKARRLAIEVHADDKTNAERPVTFTQGASEFALSADEKHVAFVVHGQIFLMPSLGGKAVRLTDNAAYNHGVAWAPDARSVIFASDQDGQEDLYRLQPDDLDHDDLVHARKFKVRQLTNTPEAEIGAGFAPDGKRLAFLRAGKLVTMRPDGSDEKVVVNDPQVFDYDWSPDSRWLVYARQDGSFASELYIVPADSASGVAPRNITRYATYNGGVTWSTNGRKLAFISQRRQRASMHVLSLQKPAALGVRERVSRDIDWDDIHLRVTEPAPLPAEEGAISPDGTRVAFRSTGSGDDLWVAYSDGGQLTRLTTGNLKPQQIQWSRRIPDLVYFRDGRGTLRTIRASVPGEAATLPFRARLVVRRDEEFQEMFEQSWRALKENFYDRTFHGANWDEVRAKYRPLVKHVALKEDLFALISLMLGELNASHLGIGGFGPRPEEQTADLGLILDETYSGPGLKIAEIVKRGPADKRGLGLKAGDIVRSIDRVELTPTTSIEKLLNDKVGEPVVLEVTSGKADPRDPKARRQVEIQGASREQMLPLTYERWVERNARRVGELSQGRLGYIHIPSMDEEGLDQFVRSLYSDNFDKEGIVLDVRYNGGGYTHDQILNYLGAKEHTFFRQRYGDAGTVLRPLDRKWSRPLVLLINNRSFSDAEIFPSAFRTLGLGKLVGQSTGGLVIGTSSVHLVDGSSFRVPRTGVYTARGVNMEREGVVPDVQVDDDPDQLAQGKDAQLDKGVEVLVQSVAAWKQEHPPVVLKPEGSKPDSTASATANVKPSGSVRK